MAQLNIFKYEHDFILESGEKIKNLELAYTTLGTLNSDSSNVIWFCHSLTSDSNVESWWSSLVGEGKLYDPNKHFIICANYLGSCYGSTGALSLNKETGEPYYHDFPQITVRDIAATQDLLRTHLDLSQIHTLIGGSLGGQVVTEWAVQRPYTFENLIILASNAKNSPWAIAFNETQRMAIVADQTWKERRPDAGSAGLRAARAIALLSYRSYDTYIQTQADPENKLWNYRAESYQNYQGDKFIKRFDAFSYWTLSKVMDSHDVGRNRGGIAAALSKINTRALVVGIDSDYLFPKNESKELATLIPNAVYKELESLYGHDGFLIEFDKLEKMIRSHYNSSNFKKTKGLSIKKISRSIAATF